MFARLLNSGGPAPENSKDGSSAGQRQHSKESAGGDDFESPTTGGPPTGPPATVGVDEDMRAMKSENPLGMDDDGCEYGEPAYDDEDQEEEEEEDDNEGINVDSLEQLVVPPDLAHAVQESWHQFCSAAESREAIGEAVYGAIFESAPSLQALFKTPRAVQAMRFMSALNTVVATLDQPQQLQILAETLGFGHLNLEVTVPRVAIFREAILELLAVEMGDLLTPDLAAAWKAVMNYLGGGIIFVRKNYADRLTLLAESWHQASGKAHQEQIRQQQLLNAGGSPRSHRGSGEVEEQEAEENGADDAAASPRRKGRLSSWTKVFGRRRRSDESSGDGGGHASPHSGSGLNSGGMSPHSGGESPRSGSGEYEGEKLGGAASRGVKSKMTYEEMFQFNVAVMGLSSRKWLYEILACWDTIVSNMVNSARLQQECDMLAVRISKCQAKHNPTQVVNLAEYKSCMLASLRGVLPKVWDSNYEVAWNWLWDNVERKLKATMNSPPIWEPALQKMFASLGEEQMYTIRKSIYENFFAAAPSGQDWFKQSNTRLHFIVERVLSMTMELFENPWRMVDEISALGLRHVGYGIPTELFGPFVSACIQVMLSVSRDETAIEAFRWSLGLISKMLVETINEGSTIVMKAINVNNEAMVKKAMSCAPRGKRAQWVLLVQVGTQSISPLLWALQSGSTAAAKAILVDLLTIRADRDRYYYGMEELFSRHPDIVALLCADSQDLLTTLFDGLVWRSRLTKDGIRRANYYVKYLIMDGEGEFAEALEHLSDTGVPQIMSDPVVNLVSDTMWTGLVRQQFLRSKIWFVISLLIFMLGQALLPKTSYANELYMRYIIFACRILTYMVTMGRLLLSHLRDSIDAYRTGDTKRIGRISFPLYLLEPYDGGSLIMALIMLLMCSHEPYFYCAGGETFPIEDCAESAGIVSRYSVFAMFAMLMHWLLIIDLAVFSTGLSAFVLVCVHVLSEIGRFLVALTFVLLTFASAITVLDHTYKDMNSVFGTAVALFAITIQIFEDDYRDFQEDELLLIMVFFFVVASAILLLNVLIAQLNCSYVYVYQNMVGFARLKRAQVIVQTLSENVDEALWSRFVDGLGLDQPLEFNPGDVGISGGMTVDEPAALKLVTADPIVRYGGSCSPEMQWPEEQVAEEEDKFERMEKLINRTLKKLSKKSGKRARAGGSGIGSSGSAHRSQGSEAESSFGGSESGEA